MESNKHTKTLISKQTRTRFDKLNKMLKLISQKSLVLATETCLLVFFVLYGRNLWVFNQLKKQISED